MKIRGTNTPPAPLNVFPTTAGDDEGSFQVDGAMIRRGSAGHAIAVTGVRRADMRSCQFISYGRMRPTNHSTCSFFAIFGIVSNVLGYPGVATIEFPGGAVEQRYFLHRSGSRASYGSRQQYTLPGLCYATESPLPDALVSISLT